MAKPIPIKGFLTEKLMACWMKGKSRIWRGAPFCGGSSHTRTQDVVRATFLWEDQPPTEAPHFAWEKDVLKISWKKQLPGTAMQLDSGGFTYTAPISVCPFSALPNFLFWTVFTWDRLCCIWACTFMWMVNFPVPPDGRYIRKIFWNIFEILWELKGMVKCHFCSESHRIIAASTKEQDLQMVSGQLVPDCGTCTFLSGRGPGGCFSPKELQRLSFKIK